MLVLALLLLFATPALAVDGMLEINQTCAVETGCFAGDTAGFPVDLSESGSYRLTGDLDASGADRAIQISVSDVTLDLNGFKIANAGSRGVTTTNDFDDFENLAVLNGVIIVEGGYAVMLGDGERARVERMRVRSGGSGIIPGITAGPHCHIADNVVSTPGDNTIGISAAEGCVVRGNAVQSGGRGITCSRCTIANNTISPTSQGIQAGASTITGNTINGGTVGIQTLSEGGCVVIGNTVTDASGFGFIGGSNGFGALAHNVFWNNNGGNANAQISSSGFIQTDANLCGTDATCP
jgi:parallel beta-helix repeat protein